MNPKQFIVLFFSAAVLVCVDATFGFEPVISGLAVQLPILTAASGTLALPLAVLGVLKLAAAASLAGISLTSILKGGAAEEDDGYHLVDDSYAPVSSGYGYRQKRHAVHRSPNPDIVFSLIKSMDLYSCGKSLVCELEAKNPAHLYEDEQLMLSLFTNRQGYKTSPNSPKAEYDYAAELGLATKDQVACRKRYASCPYTSDEMMAALRAANI